MNWNNYVFLFTVRSVVAERLCFHRPLSFCSQLGVCIPACTGADTPGRHSPHLVRHPPRQTPPGRPLQRTVRILLECILLIFFSSFCNGRPTADWADVALSREQRYQWPNKKSWSFENNFKVESGKFSPAWSRVSTQGRGREGVQLLSIHELQTPYRGD